MEMRPNDQIESQEIEEVVRDIGTSILEGDDDIFNREAEELNDYSILQEESEIQETTENIPGLQEMQKIQSMLMNKPATGHTQHRVRKNPPKKLFDYLPKGRRLIMKDPRAAGNYQVITSIISEKEDGSGSIIKI